MRIKQHIQTEIENVGINKNIWNDKDLSRLFALTCKRLARYVPESKSWYVYQKGVWKMDKEKLKTYKLAKFFSDALQEYSSKMNYPKRIIAKAEKLNDSGKRKTIIYDARCEYPISQEEFDTDVNILNCKNGTLDLSTFELKPHNPDDMLSRICNVYYDETARCERWEQFIDEITAGDKEKADYIQRILGNALTGNVQEEEFYIFYGPTTRNGKSTLLKTIAHLLNSGNEGYAVNAGAATFSGKTERKGSSPSNDIARLAGVRFVVTNELPKSMLLNHEMIKSITGGDKITARYQYGRDFEFYPQFKLVMHTNSLPLITDNSIFDSNRVRVVEFTRHFTEDEQDPTLKDMLRQPKNLSGILNWLLDGLRKVQTNGMNPPETVIQATEQYRQNFDKFTSFISDCLERSENNITMSALYRVYQKWTNENKIACEGKQDFKQTLIAKNLFSETGTVNGKTERNVVKGFAIKREYLSGCAYKETVSEVVTPAMAG